MGRAKLLIIISAVVVFCFVPMVNMPYEVVVQKQVEEQYTILEPYTTTETVRESYTSIAEKAEWQDDGSWDRYKNSIPFTVKESMELSAKVTPGRWVIKQYPIAKYRNVEKPVTKYREVTQTRLVTRPVVETQTRRVSLLRYLLR